MTFSPRLKLGCLSTLFATFCVGIGFIAGIVAYQIWKKKTDDPEFIKWTVMKHLEKLEPSAEQRAKFEPHVDQALSDITALKSAATQDVWNTIDRAADRIATHLTPDQQNQWQIIRPKRPKHLIESPNP